jgi:hypothetical protein
MSISSVTLNAGILHVVGDAGNDNVDLQATSVAVRDLGMIRLGSLGSGVNLGTLHSPTITIKDLTRSTNNTWTFNRSAVQRMEVDLGAGDDRLISKVAVPTTVRASVGNDHVETGAANDIIFGGAGNDIVYAHDGDDLVYGESDNDLVVGGSGNDGLHGQEGADLVLGGIGNDYLSGGADAAGNSLYAEAGNDHIASTSRSDIVDGGLDYDTLSVLAGTWIVRNGENVRIAVPTDQHQTDGWSCGPNSGSRFLRAYGINVSYDTLRSETAENSLISKFGFGTLPSTLKEVLEQWKSDITLEKESSLQGVLDLLGSGRLGIALVATDKKSLSIGGSYGLMHYVVLNGFDLATQTIKYVDTNGAQKSWTFAEFDYHWKWFEHFTGFLGEPAQAGLEALGLRKRTILY